MKWFRFDSKDLAANQEGILSEGQHKRLFYETTLWWKSGLLAVGYMSICGVVPMLIASARLDIAGVGGFVAIGIILAIAAFYAFRLRRDLRHNSILSATGVIIHFHRGLGSYFVLQTAKSDLQFNHLIPKLDLTQPYTVYYLPLTRRIVSMETWAISDPIIKNVL